MHRGSKARDSSRLNRLQRLDKSNPGALKLVVQEMILVKLYLIKGNISHPVHVLPKSVHIYLSICLFIYPSIYVFLYLLSKTSTATPQILAFELLVSHSLELLHNIQLTHLKQITGHDNRFITSSVQISIILEESTRIKGKLNRILKWRIHLIIFSVILL